MRRETVGLGDALVAAGVITHAQLQICIKAQEMLRRRGQEATLAALLVRHGFASHPAIEAVANQTGNAHHADASVEIPFDVCMEYQFMPLGVQGDTMRIAPRLPLSDNDRQSLLASVRGHGIPVTTLLEEPRNLADILAYLQHAASSASGLLASEIERFWTSPDDGELLQNVLNHLFADALEQRASDVHIKLSSDDAMCKVFYRIDGELTARHVMPEECMRRLVTQVKLRSGMDASERMRPQDGRMSVRYHRRDIDLRVSSASKDDGELIVIRILDQSRVVSLATMLAHHPDVLRYLTAIADVRGKHGGLVLVTGPTGMGKSTTLTGVIQAMPRDRYKVATVEDPVENRVPNVDHMSINEPAGYGFAEMLRALLRQDPDVIVVGEVRDKATAEIALRAVETGHMVLTTLHTRSVAESVVRLVSMLPDSYRDLGIFAIANNLKAVMNQMLIKKLCTCAGTIEAAADDPQHGPVLQALGVTAGRVRLSVARGCPACGYSGYRGRVLVPEAAFFSNSGTLRQEMRTSLVAPQGLGKLLTHAGVTYVSREASLRRLVGEGLCDLAQAAIALDATH
ncbi:hypothetical protein E4K72_03530 [Oxalobacteraceae bacterium OM1]|nr:hypothetical protein E4K72_03530 [Oxalobacteraceae bacterium OM1]